MPDPYGPDADDDHEAATVRMTGADMRAMLAATPPTAPPRTSTVADEAASIGHDTARVAPVPAAPRLLSPAWAALGLSALLLASAVGFLLLR